MTDICKCTGINCPLKEKCYRYTVKGNDLWQGYFTEPPYNYKIEDCNYFWAERKNYKKDYNKILYNEKSI